MIAGLAFRIEEKIQRSLTPHISIEDSQIVLSMCLEQSGAAAGIN